MSLRREIENITTLLFPRIRKRKKSVELNHRILVGTHHKTGTVWMFTVFEKICRELGWKLYRGAPSQVPSDCDVFFDGHSRFEAAKVGTEYRGLHVIRDPRDIIISGCFYHQKSEEPWLHAKQAGFGGMTYQEKINSYASLDDRILFEMEHVGRQCIEEMLAWNYQDPAFFEIQYEDLIADENLLLFHQAYSFLGFPGRVIPRLLQISYARSLFSGRLQTSTHIRSGKTKQWEQHLNAAHKARFLELFGDALRRLGYEANDDWAAETLKLGHGDAGDMRRAA